MSQLEDVVWRMVRQSRDLQEQRAIIHSLWNDDAARDINMRYLNPHSNDAGVMGRALQSQDESLNVAQKHHKLARVHGQKAREFAIQVEQLLDLAKEQQSRSYAYYDRYTELSSKAARLLPKVIQTIEQANSTC